MQKQIKDIHDYYEIITKLWGYFRKFYTNYDADQALQELKDFEEWVKYKGPRLYDFGMNLIRIAWKEVGELHEMRKENGENKS
jgi:hypothetical protein